MRSAAPSGANPGDGVGPHPSPAPGTRLLGGERPRSERGPSPARRGPGALRALGLPASPRVQVHLRGRSLRLRGRVLLCSAPSLGFRVPRCSRDPLPCPSGLARPPAWGGNRGAPAERAPDSRCSSVPAWAQHPRAPKAQRGGSDWKRSPTSSPRYSEWNLDGQEIARTRSLHLCSQPSFY